MSRKGRYKIWKTSDEVLFHLSFTTDKAKIQREKHRKNAAIFQKASWLSGVMGTDGNILSRLNKTVFVEPMAKVDAKQYQHKVFKHITKESKRLFPSRKLCFSPRFSTKSSRKINYKMAKR